MSHSENILILSPIYNFLGHREGTRPAPKPFLLHRLSLKIQLFFLKIRGYKLARLDDAFRARSGKFFCIVIEGTDRGIYRDLFPLFKSMNITPSLVLPTDGLATPGEDQKKYETKITWKQVKVLARNKWDIGTMGKESVNFADLSFAQQQEQITDASDTIYSRLGVRPKTFSYGLGSFDAGTVKIVRDAGFKYGVTHLSGTNKAGGHRLRLLRTKITGNIFKDLITLLRLSR